MDDEKRTAIILEEIRKEIKTLLHDRFGLKKGIMSESVEGNFFGRRGLLNPLELTYLAYILEIRYIIHFSFKEYEDQRFYNLGGLSEIVMEMVTEKSHREGD